MCVLESNGVSCAPNKNHVCMDFFSLSVNCMENVNKHRLVLVKYIKCALTNVCAGIQG